MDPTSFDPNGFKQYNRSHRDFSRQNRKSPTLSEKLMRNILRKDQLGYRFVRQKPLGPYILDFYCAKLQLCVEVDGPYHAATQEYDRARDAYLLDRGISTLRFSSEELLTDPDRVAQRLHDGLKQ